MVSPWGLLTGRGQVVLVLGGCVSAAAMLTHHRPLLWLGLTLVILPFLAGVLVARTLPRLRIDRVLEPAEAPVGSPIHATLRMRRLGSSVADALMLFEEGVPDGFGARPRFTLDLLGGGSDRAVAYVMQGRRRGRYRAGPLRVEIRDPFGLVRLQRGQRRSAEFLVTPVVHQLPRSRFSSGAGSAGEASPQRIGASGEDDVLVREYRLGDDVRRVHWRSTARHGDLMVRREEQSWDPSATVLVDSRRTAHRGDGLDSSFEWTVSAAASIALHLLQAGYRVDLIDAGGTHTSTHVLHDPSLGRRRLLERLAELDLTGNDSLAALVAQARAVQRSQLLVAITGTLPAVEAQRLAGLRSGNGRAVALVLNAPSFGKHRGAVPDLEGLGVLMAGGWTVASVHGGVSVPAAWSALNEAAR